jgi:hypothetical protein
LLGDVWGTVFYQALGTSSILTGAILAVMTTSPGLHTDQRILNSGSSL